MTRITALLAACGIATCLTLSACEKHDGHDHDGHSHAEGDGHDHDGDGHEHGEGGEHADGDGHDSDDHEHGEDGEHAEGDGHDDGHGGERHSLGTVEIDGVTLAVASLGDFAPGSELHLDVTVESGDAPSAVRVWVGDESGVGAMKSLLEGADGHMHGHVETSAELVEGAQLWLEVEAADGTRSTASVDLPG